METIRNGNKHVAIQWHKNAQYMYAHTYGWNRKPEPIMYNAESCIKISHAQCYWVQFQAIFRLFLFRVFALFRMLDGNKKKKQKNRTKRKGIHWCTQNMKWISQKSNENRRIWLVWLKCDYIVLALRLARWAR